ncbi:unnamed protein product [Parajaminaea phylloscopi]
MEGLVAAEARHEDAASPSKKRKLSATEAAATSVKQESPNGKKAGPVKETKSEPNLHGKKADPWTNEMKLAIWRTVVQKAGVGRADFVSCAEEIGKTSNQCYDQWWVRSVTRRCYIASEAEIV